MFLAIRTWGFGPLLQHALTRPLKLIHLQQIRARSQLQDVEGTWRMLSLLSSSHLAAQDHHIFRAQHEHAAPQLYVRDCNLWTWQTAMLRVPGTEQQQESHGSGAG